MTNVMRSRNSDVREQVERQPTAEVDGRDVPRGRRNRQRLLQPRREEHDPGDHREMQVPVEVPRQRGMLGTGRLDQLCSVTIGTQSKYVHHSAAATVIPSRAAVISPA